MQEELLDIREYIDAVRRRWWLLLVGPVVGVIGLLVFGVATGGAIPVSAENGDIPPLYRATALVLMEGKNGLGNSPNLVETRPVMEEAIDKSGLALSVPELRVKVSASPITNTNLMEIYAEDSRQDHAVAIANAVSESLVEYIGTLRQARFNSPSLEFSEQLQDTPYALLGVGLTDVVNQPLVVAPAEVVQLPTGSEIGHTGRNVLLAAFAGALASLVAVIMLEYRRQPVGSSLQFSSRTGLAPIGRVPRWRNRDCADSPLVVSSGSNLTASEALRTTAINLELAAGPGSAKILAVVSPGPGDGRSTLLANLGVALADAWNEVVLVDTNLRMPSLHRQFGLDNQVGLTSLLLNPTMTINEALQETQHSRLKVVTSGPVFHNPLEVLRCPRMTWLLEQLKETSDIVMLDTPPALAVADAVALASQSDGVVLVINDRNTPWEQVWTLLADLERTGTPIIGYIWNRATIAPWTFPSQWQRYCRKMEPGTAPSFTTSDVKETDSRRPNSANSVGPLAFLKKT